MVEKKDEVTNFAQPGIMNAEGLSGKVAYRQKLIRKTAEAISLLGKVCDFVEFFKVV